MAMAAHSAGCAVGLLAPFARLGENGQEWSLSSDCPVCAPVAQFIGPVAAIHGASRSALYLVGASLVLNVAALLMLFDVRTASVSQAVVTAIGAFALASAPLAFDRLLPDALPVHLAWGGFATLGLGLIAFVLSALVAMQLTVSKERRDERTRGVASSSWAADPITTTTSLEAGTIARPDSFVAGYGSIRDPSSMRP